MLCRPPGSEEGGGTASLPAIGGYCARSAGPLRRAVTAQRDKEAKMHSELRTVFSILQIEIAVPGADPRSRYTGAERPCLCRRSSCSL